MRTLLLALTFVPLVLVPSSGQAQAPPVAAPLEPNPAAPLYRHLGEQYRVYNFPETGESIPYRLFVPASWTEKSRLPVLVTLRAGPSIDNPHRPPNSLVAEAARRGYIVVTPMGYRPLRQPYYGSRYRIARPDAAEPAAGWTAEEDARAEQDVLNVIDLVTKEYNADASRIYLHGQNPSASGARHLAAKYPERFRALVLSSGPIEFASYPWPRLAGQRLLVIHGDQDTVNPIAASQRMAAAAKAAGVDATFATVSGGTHLEAYLTYARQIFDFLDATRRPGLPPSLKLRRATRTAGPASTTCQNGQRAHAENRSRHAVRDTAARGRFAAGDRRSRR